MEKKILSMVTKLYMVSLLGSGNNQHSLTLKHQIRQFTALCQSLINYIIHLFDLSFNLLLFLVEVADDHSSSSSSGSQNSRQSDTSEIEVSSLFS